ncbi:GCN5 [Hepatospora eriocheir]|uniref:histone acetyltransferase n=1 Tax=Hepatospora eriocheir TaxID=1081669 RepID=A0A1X0QCX4_9MICR|nr:GCN5 [Hepatospora eriocheir]
MNEFFKFGESKLTKEQEMLNKFKNEKFKIKLCTTAYSKLDPKELLRVKVLFQKMLPKMPKDYILRQVFDPKQCIVMLCTEDEKIIVAAACFRPAYSRNLVELVFLAVSNESHLKGYGTFIVNVFKETIKYQYIHYLTYGDKFLMFMNNYIKLEDFKIIYSENDENKRLKYSGKDYTSSVNLYIYTYADNSAVGFFKKQGFTFKPVGTMWRRYIKDYEGGTLMECKIHKDLNYLQQSVIINKIKEKIETRMKEISSCHIIHSADEKIDLPISDNEERTKEDFLRDFITYLIYSLESNPSSWPFLEPVTEEEAPGYYSIIKHPMDLSKIAKKHKNNHYQTLNLFINDVNLMVENCLTFNEKESQYAKCSLNIKKCLLDLINKHSETIKKWKVK